MKTPSFEVNCKQLMDLIHKLLDLIHKLLDFVFPILTVTILIFVWPVELVFKFFDYLRRSVYRENLAGKIVLITGASSGIGEHLAYEYAKRGARLALVARREELLKVVAEKARDMGSPDVIVISADVSKLDDCKSFVDETINHFGSLDHLINNAGICWVQDQRCVSDYVSMMDINFWGSIYTTQFAIPHLRKTKGKITVVASAAGCLPLPRLSIYGASKAALISFFETLRVEVDSDIGITIVTPGLIESPITNDEWLLQTNLHWMPLVSVEGCAKTIVDSTSRGDEYLTVPTSMRLFFQLKLLCPWVLKWISRFLIIICSNDPLLNRKPHTNGSCSTKSQLLNKVNLDKMAAKESQPKNSDFRPLWMAGTPSGTSYPSGSPSEHDSAYHRLISFTESSCMMDMIHKFLDFVFPIITLTILIFVWPLELVFKFFDYLRRSVYHEKLAGKVVLITGASSGIGEYLAYEYAKRGARLALVARREELLEVVAGKAREMGSPDVIVISADVSKLDDCKRFVDETVNHFVDHLVNNAGIAWVHDQRCVSDYVPVMDINFWGSIYTTQFAIPHLQKTKGKISVIASAAGWLPMPRLSIYCASKAAMISFFETLRIEVGSDIGITIVTPGLIESAITNDEWLLQVPAFVTFSNLYF
ncbi:hypothetical protein OSB04_004500 [Centaurea solstitialis]|uniref:11-beta-hydroxysteroid dehydrogenase-like 4A n=1 Tax=Centaurea solstitialis TaxID=347529 RepID=A0AA38WVM4_9ASTR|nr:hypothetical protein OSB04_004500 [Centaurea solstitialis]